MKTPAPARTWAAPDWRPRSSLASLCTLWRFLASGKAILFLARFPTAEDLKDGYFQRVKTIDACFAGRHRIYLDCESNGAENRVFPTVLTINENVLEIRPCAGKRLHRFLLLSLARLAGRAYAHSILRLDSGLARKLFAASHKRILDLHGVVPEEFAFHGEPAASQIYSNIEKSAAREATAIICVTRQMADHFRRKHALDEGKSLIILPILSVPESAPGEPKPFAGPSVIYCGGLQKWQQVEKMLAFAYWNRRRASFAFLVPEPEKLLARYRQIYGGSFPGIVCSAAAHEVKRWYQRYSFGLVLRENVIVNNAACPTKLIEYLQHDIVPIVDSPAIGDFIQFNYAYVHCEDVLPGESQWRQMVMRNQDALRQVQRLFSAGLVSLREHV